MKTRYALALLILFLAVVARAQNPVWPITSGGGGASLPSQVGNAGEFLTTNGTVAAWAPLAGGGDMLAANNLSDLASAVAARTNLGVAIGTNVQAYDGDLTIYAGITPSANVQSFLGAADYAAMRTQLITSGVIGPTELASTAVTPGAYTNANITIDADGRITLAANGSGGVGVTDGDKGDITVSASGATWTLDTATVTLAKMANMATGSFIGRNTASTGVPEVLSIATAKTMLNLAGTNSGDQTAAGPLTVVASGFDGNLTTLDDTVQKFAQKFDDLVISGGGNVSNSGTPASGQLAEWMSATVIQGIASTGTGAPVRTSSPTIVTPTIASFANATHDHANAAGGGVLTDASIPNTITIDLATTATNLTRTLNVAGTANEITSSVGAQDFTANRTVTLSLPTALTFTGKTVTGGTFNATTLTGAGGGISLIASGFDGNLATTDDTLQKVAQKLDDLIAGSALILDLLDDASNESTSVGKIATTGDTNNIFTEPSANKLLIAVGNAWPIADVANAGDHATNFFTAGQIERTRGGLGADTSGYGEGLIGSTTGGITVDVDTIAKFSTALGITGTQSGSNALFADGAWKPVTATASGSDTWVQANNGGVLGSEAAFNYNFTTDTLSVPVLSVTTLNAQSHKILDAVDQSHGLSIVVASNLTANKTLTYTGAFNANLTFTADSAITFPTSGTLATTTELALKAPLISPSFTTPTLGAATATTINKVAVTAPAASATLTIADGKTLTASQDTVLNRQASTGLPVEIQVACSDLTTAITTGTSKAYFRSPYAFTLTEVRASVLTAPTGSTILIDVNESGTTVISTKVMIDATEFTSQTAVTPYVISDSAIADDAVIQVDFDQVGSTVAGAGVIVTLKGYR